MERAGSLLRFRERAACVQCGGTALEVLWSGRFRDEPVRGWLDRFHYEADVDRALGNETYERVRCRACGMAFHRRVLDDASAKELYERWIGPEQIDRFEEEVGRRGARDEFQRGIQQTKHVLRLRRILRGGEVPLRVLDFGCGDGRFLGLAAAFGLHAYGVDFSATRQGRAQRRGQVVVESLAEIDEVAPGRMDAVTLFQVLEHVTDPVALLAEVGKRLRPGGVLVVEVPDASGIEAPRTFEEFHVVHPLEHVNHFTPRTLRALGQRAGYAPIARLPAHVTTAVRSVLRTEASRFVRRPATNQYFRRPAEDGLTAARGPARAGGSA